MHLTVTIDKDTSKLEILKPDSTKKIFDPWAVPPTPISPIKKQNITYSHFRPVFEVGLFSTKNSSENQFLDTTTNNWFSNHYGFDLILENRYINYSTGVRLTTFYEFFDFQNNWNTVDTTILTDIIVNTHWEVDTFWYLNLDSLLIGDTVWTPYYDSNPIYQYDTLFSNRYDTTFNNNSNERVNKIRFIEFPVIFGYHYKTGNWKFNFNVGIIAGFPIYQNYIIILPRDEGVVSGMFSKVSFWSYTAISGEYKISKRLSGKFGFYVRIPLNEQITVLGIKRKYYSYGLTFGLNIKLNK